MKNLLAVLVLATLVLAIIAIETARAVAEQIGRRWLILIGISAAVVLVLMLSLSFSHAHDHNRPELAPWFKSLQSKGKALCCDGSDALSIDDPDWDNDSGHYRVRLEGEWVDVPDDAVIDEPNRAGHALVWPWRKDGKLNQIRCFMPGSMT